LLLWSGFVLPWLSLFLMKKKSIYRYMPVCIFSALLVTIVYEIGYTYKWWILKDAIVPWGHVTNTAFAYGVFLVGTMWVFHFTFGRFWLYVVANLLLDAFYAFVFHRIEEKLGIADLINVKHYHILLLMVEFHSSCTRISYGKRGASKSWSTIIMMISRSGSRPQLG
jgi:hypothetical protein